MRVLAIAAHPDDIEILCAGTLARFVEEGHHVTACHASLGDKGHAVIPHGEVAGVRRAEARAAAEALGADSITLGFLDGEIHVGQESLRKVVDAIRGARPDVLITHHPDDYHGDHNAVTKLVLDASFMATVPHFVGEEESTEAACPIFFMDTLAGVGFEPTDYVDIGSTIDVKQRAMSHHESQLGWLSEHHATDVHDLIETMARFRGLQCGVRHAEGFQRLHAWGRNPPTRLLP